MEVQRGTKTAFSFCCITIILHHSPGSSATLLGEKALRWVVMAYSMSAHFNQHCLISALLKCNHSNNGTNMLLMFHCPAPVPLPSLFPSLPSSLPLSPHGSGLNDNQKKFFIIWRNTDNDKTGKFHAEKIN